MNQAVIFQDPTILGRLLQQEPVFDPSQEVAITADSSSVITDHSGQRWCALATWVGFSTKAGTAIWQCRGPQLTITLPAVVTDTQVLPFSAGSPSASLALLDNTPMPLSPVLDASGLRLIASFGADAAGRAAYDAAIGALSNPGGARVTLTNSHTFTVQTVAPPPPDPMPPVILYNPNPGLPIMQRPAFPLATESQVQPSLATQSLTAQSLAAQPLSPQPVIGSAVRNVDLSNAIAVDRSDWGRVFIPVDPPPQGQASHTVTIVQQGVQSLAWRAQSDAGAFPDIPRQNVGGWLEVTPSGSTRTLHCMPGGRPELFYYLPTEYKLGFHAGGQGGVPATPFRVTMARAGSGNTTITVTMTAIPYLADGDRAELRSYLLQHELMGTEPYVELEAASGLTATFQADFYSQGQPVAGSSIQYSLDGAVSSDLLQIKFTMDQLDYGLLVPMLQHGITGTVVLADGHISVSVPVGLRLDDVVTDALEVMLAAIPNPPPDPFSGTLSVTNQLAYPVTLGAIDLDLVYSGQQSDIVFDAEQLHLLSAPLALPASASSSALTFVPTLASWTRTAVTPGVVAVQGPAPADWIATVNRDPSLQPSKVTITVSPTVQAAHLADVRAVTVAVYAAGASTPRQPPQDIPPSGPTTLELELTLTDLAAGIDLHNGFVLEFTSWFADDTRSLPQRVAVDLTVRSVDLVVLWEPPGASYFLDSDTTIGPVTRDVAGQVIDTLRLAGKTWRVRAVAPTPAPAPPTPPAPAPAPAPS